MTPFSSVLQASEEEKDNLNANNSSGCCRLPVVRLLMIWTSWACVGVGACHGSHCFCVSNQAGSTIPLAVIPCTGSYHN